MEILLIFPFISLLLYSVNIVKLGINNKLIVAIVLISLFVTPMFIFPEIFSWFGVDGGAIMAYTMLAFYIVLLLFIINLKKDNE